jgi:hypothetical protein
MNNARITRPLPWKLIAIWLLASALAAISCGLNFSSAQLNGEYLPMGNDSFYHARRILDTVHDPGSFYQFDSKIHAPEGSLLVWPWGYDYAVAMIVRGAMAVGISSDPMAILIWIPVAAVLISIALMIAIARQLGLSRALTTVAALCLALSPTTQLLHAVGLIDHHYAEFIFILAALAAGLAWLRQPENPTRALAPAIVMGLAPAIHNGLFIIQLPLLITLFVMWLQGRSMPARNSWMFGIGLLITTLAILVPSLPFRLGHFEFYTLSWFHLYIAMCTAVTVVLLSRLKPTRNGIAILLVSSAVLLIPIAAELAIARSFLAGVPKILQMISEMLPPMRAARIYGVSYISNYYSYLLWIVPLTTLLCAYQAYRERLQPRLLFWITSLMGLALLVSQIRMHYFGSFALYLPWLIVVQEFCERSPQHFKRAVLLTVLGMLIVYFPPLRHQLLRPTPIAHDVTFREIRPMLETLKEQCAEDPGIVLADSDAGHYIRYYTDCPTIVNNFLLTPQQFKKVDEAMHLFMLTARQLKEQAPLIKYVLVRPIQNIKLSPNGFTFKLIGGEPRLAEELFGPADSLPPEFKLIHEAQVPELNNTVYARLYKIRRDARSQPAPSANDVGE